MVQTILDLFASAKLVKTEKGYCDPQFVGLALLARTLSNLKGTLILLDNRSIVEARVLTRCCIENAFWAVGLTAEGDSFVREMQNDTIHHQRQRGQNLFATGAPLDEEVRDKLRAHLKEIGKQYQNPAQLNPSGVAKRGSARPIHIFYEQLSADAAHPSLDALNRYVLPPTQSEPQGIDVEPVVDAAEIVETLEYLSLAVLGVCFSINELLNGIPGAAKLNDLAQRHVGLSNRTGGASSTD